MSSRSRYLKGKPIIPKPIRKDTPVTETEPQIQEVLGIAENRHDYFLQFTDARPDTGGLSGATPAEAVTWGKIDPDKLLNTVVCYLDATVAMPILAAYALSKHKSRKLKRLYDLREEMFHELKYAYAKRISAKLEAKRRRSGTIVKSRNAK
jgi:hypothetical protein